MTEDYSSISNLSDIDISDDENIEYNKNKKNKNNIIKIQIDTIERIINMFPKALEKHKKEIISTIIGNKEKEEKLILTKIVINGIVYYRFHNGLILDTSCKIKGIYILVNNNYYYYPFIRSEEKYKYLSEIKKYHKYLEILD